MSAMTLALCVVAGVDGLAATPGQSGIRIASGLPVPNSQPPEWRLPVLVRVGGEGVSRITPVVEVARGRVVAVVPETAECEADGSAVFFVRVVGDGSSKPPELIVRIKEIPQVVERSRLGVGVDLTQLSWERWYQGEGSRLEQADSVPPGSVTWTPAHVPSLWQELGVTWLRTRPVIPEAWRGRPLQLRMRAIDDADRTFLNGRAIGQTTGWDQQRAYGIPQDVVRWGQSNELQIAVDNVNAGGGLYRTPIVITVGEAVEGVWPFPPAVMEAEQRRAPVGEVGPRVPLRRMVVDDGVLRYEDGMEVALWGVNTYPQSWTQFKSLRSLGIDPYGTVDEDFEDFVEMGIDIIRIHVFDTEISDGQGNLICNDHLDILDYLVAQCNRHGMYLMLTPIAWWGSPGERPDSFSRNTPKQAMSMWPERWSAQVNYVRQFLNHRNPYTSRRLVDEPCLGLFEVINEPTYWSYGEIIAGEPGVTHVSVEVSKRGLAGVRSAWERFIPSAEWASPCAFACFRYVTLRRYINTMIGAIRGTGARQPIAYSTFDSGEVDIAEAIGDSRCDAITLGAYPGGLSRINDGVNLLGETRNGELDSRFAMKARLVYEFDAAGMVSQVCMYPAMARRWRNVGVQVACQFQYDARSLGHLNWDWPIHYLNLWHTPGKVVSFLIGGEAFRRLPRGAAFSTPADDQVFPPAAVSFRRNTAVLCAEDCYMQTGPTEWRPMSVPRSPAHILTVGSCPYFEYEGTGVVDLRIEDDGAELRIYPDVERLQGGLRGTVEKPLTRLQRREHRFRLLLDGWRDARVERLGDEGGWRGLSERAGDFAAVPGRYGITR
ncbi:MAG: hypothetical protein JXQ73_19075 [Phycisphaerae bacterium]|nr:hypothetical protein [Phycisphaerae bacterium]